MLGGFDSCLSARLRIALKHLGKWVNWVTYSNGSEKNELCFLVAKIEAETPLDGRKSFLDVPLTLGDHISDGFRLTPGVGGEFGLRLFEAEILDLFCEGLEGSDHFLYRVTNELFTSPFQPLIKFTSATESKNHLEIRFHSTEFLLF